MRRETRLLTPALLALTAALLLLTRAPSQAAGCNRIGDGCPGTAGVPDLTPAGGDLPILGELFTLHLGNVPDSSLAVGFIGLAAPAPLHLDIIGMPGCFLYTAIDWQRGLGISGGRATWHIQLPSGPDWIGRQFYLQSFVVDVAAPGIGSTMSNAYECTIGISEEDNRK